MLPVALAAAVVALVPMPDDHPHVALRRVKVVTAPEVFAEQLGRYGFDHLDAKRPAEALVAFDASLRLTPDVAFILWGRATTLAALGRHDDAADTYARMLALNPNDRERWQLVASGWVERGKLTEAEACFAHAYALSFTEGVRFDTLGREAALWSGASPRQKWPKVLRGSSRHASASDAQLAAAASERLVRAEMAMSRALALETAGEPNSKVEGYLGRAALRYHLGRLKDAVSDMEEALALAPTHAEAHYIRGYAAKEQKDVAEALAHLELAARFGASPVKVAETRCDVFSETGEYAKAEEEAREWCRLNPKSEFAFCRHGELLRLLGKDDEADRATERAAELIGRCPALQLLFQARDLRDKYGQTIAGGRVFMRLPDRPGLTRRKYATALANRALYRQHCGCDDEAFEELSLAVRLEPTLPNYREARAQSAFLARRYNAAIEDAEALLRIRPGDPTAAELLRKAREAVALQAGIAGREPDFRPVGPVVRVPITVSYGHIFMEMLSDLRP